MEFFQTTIKEIVGRQLSSVDFVEDYVQFQFDGSLLTAFTLPHLLGPTETVTSENPRYRQGFLSEVGATVNAVIVTEDELRIDLANSSAITVSLHEQDYIGPEAINYTALNGTIVVA